MFTPYYILAVCFGAFAVIVSVIGIKDKSGSFPGRFFGPLIVIGALFAISTFAFVWRGGEKELDHINHEKAAAAHEAGQAPAAAEAANSAE